MVVNHTFPQTGDNDDAENFAQLIGHEILSDYVRSGMDLTADYAGLNVTIGDGVCFISTASSTASSTSEERLNTNHVVQMAQSTPALTDGAVNHVYVEPNLGTDDNPSYAVYTDETNATADALKIGEVDTSANSTTEVNRSATIDNNLVWHAGNDGAGSGLDADTVDGQQADDLGRASYVQDAKPSNPSVGETWYDTGSGTYKVYADTGNGAQWVSDAPISDTDKARSFEESDVSVTLNKTRIVSGHIELEDLESGSTVTNDAMTTNTGSFNEAGNIINPNTDLQGIEATLNSGVSGHSYVRLLDSSGTVLAEDTSPSTTTTFEESLTAGNDYYIVTGAGGNDYTFAWDDSAATPYTSSDVDMTGSWVDGSIYSGRQYNFDSVTALHTVTDGDAEVSFDSTPDYIQAWDLVDFFKTDNGGSVTVDVIDGSGTTLHSNVGKNFDLSHIATSTDVGIRANLDRTDTTENPTFDYCARKFIGSKSVENEDLGRHIETHLTPGSGSETVTYDEAYDSKPIVTYNVYTNVYDVHEQVESVSTTSCDLVAANNNGSYISAPKAVQILPQGGKL